MSQMLIYRIIFLMNIKLKVMVLAISRRINSSKTGKIGVFSLKMLNVRCDSIKEAIIPQV